MLRPFRFDPALAAWRVERGRVLVVGRAAPRIHRLDAWGSEVWRALVAAPSAPDPAELAAAVSRPPGSVGGLASAEEATAAVAAFLAELARAGLIAGGSATDEPSAAAPALPHRRRVRHGWELTVELARSPRCVATRVGEGWLLRSPDGAVWVLGGRAARLWGLLETRPRTLCELYEAAAERPGTDAGDAEDAALDLVAAWCRSGAVGGLAPPLLRRVLEPEEAAGRGLATRGEGWRRLGRLEPMGLAAGRAAAPNLGPPLTLRDGSGRFDHVAIVCQYGIRGLAPGVDPYSRRSIAQLRELAPDLVVLSGGGRHGDSPLREAESVIDRYRELLPGPALWLDRHSGTTWENLQHGLELLRVRGVVPRRVTMMGDRCRTEKLRLACWIARRRFPELRAVEFRVAPVRRPRFTWRDRRPVQLAVGLVQIWKESRDARPAVAAGP